MPRTRPAAALPKCYRFNRVCDIDTMEVREPLDRENSIRTSHVIYIGTRYHQGARKQDMTLETFSTLRQFWLKHYDAMEVLIMDQGTEFGADFQHLCQSRSILPVVTEQIFVVEPHGALFKMAFEEACSLEAPTADIEANGLINFTFAELNRRLGRVGFPPGHRDFWTTTSTSVKFARRRFHRFRHDRSGKHSRDAADRGYANGSRPHVRCRRQARSTTTHSRQQKSQRALVAGENVFTHRWEDGAQGWRGHGVCVLSEEPTPARNETVWVHFRNCLYKRNHTPVRTATNEEAKGIETATSSLPSLTEADREGHTQHFADISDEGSSDDDEPKVVEGGVMDACLGRPDSQPEPALNAPAPITQCQIRSSHGARGRGLDFSLHGHGDWSG